MSEQSAQSMSPGRMITRKPMDLSTTALHPLVVRTITLPRLFWQTTEVEVSLSPKITAYRLLMRKMHLLRYYQKISRLPAPGSTTQR